MAEKRFYWLKLDRNFFKRHDIQIVESMPNGKDYVLFYLKLLVESIDHEGLLRFNDTIPYDDNMLSTITRTNVDIVRSAITVFEKLGLMEMMDDKTIYLTETTKMLGESSSTNRVREYRERQKQLQLNERNVTETLHETEKELEKDKDIELDKEKEKDKDIDNNVTNNVTKCVTTTKRFTKPSLEEVSSYCLERNNGINAQHFIDYYTANGWKVGKNAMKDWKAAIRTWERNTTKDNHKETFSEEVERRARALEKEYYGK